MITVHEEYVVDEQGRRKAVIVPMQPWNQILESLEELDDLRAYDNAKSQPADPVPFGQAVREIRDRKVE